MGENTKSTTGLVLIILASGQFLMTLDMSVMNVSIAQVAEANGVEVQTDNDVQTTGDHAAAIVAQSLGGGGGDGGFTAEGSA